MTELQEWMDSLEKRVEHIRHEGTDRCTDLYILFRVLQALVSEGDERRCTKVNRDIPA